MFKPHYIAGLIALSLTACAPPKPIIRTQTVTVKVPAFMPLNRSLTTPLAYPLIPTPMTNADLADYALQCTTKLNEANDRLGKIRGLQPNAHR